MNGAGLGSCPVADFGISGVELPDSAYTELVCFIFVIYPHLCPLS